jgi:hypothetical protein
MESDWRWRMRTHDQFEELCALACAGEIGTEDAKLLEQHLEECTACRSVFADLREIHAQWLPAHWDSANVLPSHADWRLRQGILKRARSEGAQFSEHAFAAVPARPAPSIYPQFVALTAAVLVSIALGIWIGNRHETRSKYNAMVTVKGAEVNKRSEVKSVLNEELLQDEQGRIALERQLRSAQEVAARLGKQLEEKQASLIASEQSDHSAENAVAELRRQLQNAHTREMNTEVQLEKLRATDEAVTSVQQQEIEALNNKLAAKSASLDRERDMLSAGREIRDLIAARNLHIIDVYDTNAEGKTSRAFGRVFYTEGKSLVFYAYDLNAHQSNAAKLSFYVWGKRDGAPQNVKSLGRMSKDDQTQKRWALTITDPKTLAEIDSVFVTLEPAENSGRKPTGKPLLSAFLGSPANHP